MQKQKQLKVFRQKCATPCVKSTSCQSVSVRFSGNSCQTTHAPFGVAGKPAICFDNGAVRFSNSTQNSATPLLS
ncbi:MAG TPA: hypothetical protein PK239_10695 [Chitinophagales bacterium]|nr:hypothetical protein [Chitinophagales bacterium]HRK27736.1 hypothetical protein [Chitinophagales bacterium]